MSRTFSRLRIFLNLVGLVAFLMAPLTPALGQISLTDLTAPNLVGDSNVESNASSGPSALTIGAKVCNMGLNPVKDLVAHVGDGVTPGTFPITVAPGPDFTGNFALELFPSEGPTRFEGRRQLLTGECIAFYYQVLYETVDAMGNATWGKSNDDTDDLVMDFTIWASGTDTVTDVVLMATLPDSVTVRNEITANPNKISPNPAGFTAFVPDDGMGGPGAVAPGELITVTFNNATLGSVNQGFDADMDGNPDYDAWFQPIGEGFETVGGDRYWDPEVFRLVSVEATFRGSGGGCDPMVDIVTDTDQWYLDRFDIASTTMGPCSGWDGTYRYTFISLSEGVSRLSPYQEVASGSLNEKFNGDYCGDDYMNLTLGTLDLVTQDPDLICVLLTAGPATNLTLVKDVDKALATAGETLSYTMTFNNVGSAAVGNADIGLEIYDSVPANTTFVSGTATCSLAACTILYSTDGGSTWEEDEPVPASLVTDMRFVSNQAVPASTGGTVGFNVVIDNPYTGMVSNEANLRVANGPILITDDAVTTVNDVSDLRLTKIVDDATPSMGGSVVFTITVTNDGPDDATGVTIRDVLPLNLNYSSDDSMGTYNTMTGVWTIGALANGASAILQITATADYTGTRTNIAEVGTSDQADSDSSPGNDDGDQSEDDEDAASVTVGDNPVIGIAKSATASSDVGGGVFETALTFTVENLGNVDLASVQVTDDLSTTFPAPATFSVTAGPATTGSLTANGSFDGSGDTNLLAGTDSLAVGATATISVTVQFDPNGTPGPFNNSATGSAQSPGGTPTSDTTDDGTDPDPDGDGEPDEPGENDPTPISFSEEPVIGVAKSASASTDVGGGVFETTLTFVVENLGNVDLSSVQVADDLDATFPAPVTYSVTSGPTSVGLTANGGFDGSGDTNLLAGTDSLAVGATATISVTVQFNPNGAPGPFNNSATGSGQGAGGTLASDTSDNGTDPDPNGNGDPTEAGENDPTPISFSEDPVIGVAKQASATTDLGGGLFETTLTFVVENLGNVDLSSVQVTDDLDTTFPAPVTFSVTAGPSTTGGLTANGSFDGSGDTNLLAGSDILAIGTMATVNVAVQFFPNGIADPFNNQAVASGQSPIGTPTTDQSDDGTDPDPDGDGEPDEPGENDPTPISFSEEPVIGVAKQTSDITYLGPSLFEATLTFTVENFGNVVLESIQVTDDLDATFPPPVTYSVTAGPTSAGLTANGSFDGSSDLNLLAGSDTLAIGSTEAISLTVQFAPNGAFGPFVNQAVASGQGPGGVTTNDLSTDGTDPDPDGDGDPGGSGEAEPTIIELASLAIPTLGETALWTFIALIGMMGIRRIRRGRLAGH